MSRPWTGCLADTGCERVNTEHALINLMCVKVQRNKKWVRIKYNKARETCLISVSCLYIDSYESIVHWDGVHIPPALPHPHRQRIQANGDMIIIMMLFVFDLQSWDVSMAALHVWVALIVPGCVHVCLRFAVDVGSSGVWMFHVLILMSTLVLAANPFIGRSVLV